MSERPLEVPRRDPTASQGIYRAERGTERRSIPFPAGRDPAYIPAGLTYEDAKGRRETLVNELFDLNLAIAAALGGERTKLVNRKLLVERAVAQLKKTIAQLQPPPVSNPKVAPERYAAMAEAMVAAGGTEMLYRMYRMFSFYTHGNDGMADEHRAFMGGVVGTLKAAGYDTKKPHEGDPLAGFAAEKEEAA